jgi:hypothetical protein
MVIFLNKDVDLVEKDDHIRLLEKFIGNDRGPKVQGILLCDVSSV